MTLTHKFDEKHAKFLDSEEREKILPRHKIIDFVASLLPLDGKVVADVGAGTGYFAIPLLDQVGSEGTVIAVDINDKLLSLLKEKAPPKPSLEIVLSEEDSIPIADETVDLAFCADLLHELDGDTTLREIRRILKPGCYLVVIDWEKGKDGWGPPDHVRLTRENALLLCERVGFTPVVSFEPGEHHYGLVFQK